MKKDLNYLPTNLLTLKGNPSPSIPLPRRGKKAAFTKPSRGMSVSERRTIINENRAFRVDCERCRFTRGAAFTLAEVLITLAIVGVVAALTIPSLIQKQTEKATVVKLKKAYSTLLNAYRLAEDEYGDPRDGLDWSNSNNYKRPFLERLIPYLQVGVDCKDNINICFVIDSYHGSHTATLEKTWARFLSTPSAVLLKDGTLIAILQSANRGKKHVWIMVDINGKKKPNAYGHDTFFFYVDNTNKKLEPNNAWKYPFSHESCMLGQTTEQAVGCAWWVLTNENLDYLHCDLDWDTQTKCE